MGYQVLARKWRPKTFDELAGQEHVLKALVNALENQRLHHAYLFTGTRGVGKTTIARILARSLNCETGVTASPCGVCSACQEINEGRFVDLIEVDAASRTKVEDTRELLENIQYRPTRGRYKIYLIDEVHMLSTHSFNALLKTLEEPPEHVKFLLATTDPQKLPVTVLSRCLQFNLKNLTGARIQEHLQYILGEEKIPAESEALWHLARAARGSMRDALSLTDQAISHGGGKLSEDDVVTMLGTVDRKRIYELLDGLAAGNVRSVLDTADSLAEFSPDYFALVEEMLSLMHAVAVQQTLPDTERNEGFESEKLRAYCQAFSPEDVQLIYQMLLMGNKDLRLAPDLHVGFEMLLLRLLAFQPAREGEVLAEPQSADSQLNDEDHSAKKPEAALGTAQGGAVKNQHEDITLSRAATSQEVEPTPDRSQHHSEPKNSERNGSYANQYPQDQRAEDAPETKSHVDEGSPQPASAVQPAYGLGSGEVSSEDETDVDHSAEHMAAEYAEWAVQDRAVPENDIVDQRTEPEQSQRVAAHIDEQLCPPPKKLADVNADNWISLFNHLPLRGMVRTLCAHLVVSENSREGIAFNLAEPGQKVFEQSHQDKLAHALNEYFGQAVQTRVNMGGVERETPAEYAERRYQEKLVQAEESILQSPLVQRLVEEFGAELVPGSVHLNNSDV